MNHRTTLHWDNDVPREILSTFESLKRIHRIGNSEIIFSVTGRWAKTKDIQIKQI